ncbi:MAG: hypothetical protein KIT77_20965 [Caldilinea sp.]|nr:hypothetical protein [Caldilinea sp.]
MPALHLIAPHPREECRRLLLARTDTPLTLRGANPVIGRIGPARLRLHKRIAYRNSFQTFLVADMAERGGQTHLHCRFAPHLLVIAFMAAWFAAVIAAVVLMSGPALVALADAPHAATILRECLKRKPQRHEVHQAAQRNLE